MIKINVKLLSENATLPKRGSEHAAGLDLFATEDVVLSPGERKAISTGVIFEIKHTSSDIMNNTRYYLRIAPRSGLALNQGIDVLAGVIDEDYRDEVKVILINHSNQAVIIPKTKAIAQGILEGYAFVNVNKVDYVSSTERGTGGFGSTDKQ